VTALLAALLAFSPGIDEDCHGWESRVYPPRTIRVLRDHGIERVPFRHWVVTVAASGEAPGWQPYRSLVASIFAIKQYGWWAAIHPHRSSRGCYDVRDRLDGGYRPETANVTPVYRRALAALWPFSLHRGRRPGRRELVMTGYRSGEQGAPCLSDWDGHHLYSHSAMDCARDGRSARWMLRRYFTTENRRAWWVDFRVRWRERHGMAAT
jgi:hypothetical protein